MLSGHCSPDGQQTPFLPFIEVVRTSFQIGSSEAEISIVKKLETGLIRLGLYSARNLGLLLHLFGLKEISNSLSGLDGVMIGLRTRELLYQMLEARCRLSPVMLAVEDLHSIDSGSEGLLSKIIEGGVKSGLLVLSTRRPDYVPPWIDRAGVCKIDLEPLSQDHIQRLVQFRLDLEALPRALVRQVAERAEGNPLFAEEIVSFLAEQGTLRVEGGKLDFDTNLILPASLQGLLAARVDRLSPEYRTILQAASVIGRRFDPQLLRPR